MKKYQKSLLITLFAAFAFNPYAQADVRLPKLISDGMVLQRDKPLKIWGWASPGEKVTVSFMKKKYSVVAGTDGKWQIIEHHSSVVPV